MLGNRISKEAHDDVKAQEHGKPFFERLRAEKRGPHAVQGKQHHYHADDRGLPSLPDPGVGLPVVLFHYAVDAYISGGRSVYFVVLLP